MKKFDLKTISAFLAVYVIWGSTYLAIRYGIETIPPVLMAGIRFIVSSVLMMAIALAMNEKPLSRLEMKVAATSGALLLGANATVGVVEKYLPSGLVAVVIGMTPIWFMLLSWGFFGGARPTGMKSVGAIVGLAGVGLIAVENIDFETSATSGFPFLLLFCSCMVWVFGTLAQKRVSGLKSGFRFSALQMLVGGLTVLVWSLATGEAHGFTLSQVSERSWTALAYLIVFGSLVAFSAYNWLSRNVEPHLVSTYALVNPVVAVTLGVIFYDEPLSTRFAAAVALVLVGLGMMMKPARVGEPENP